MAKHEPIIETLFGKSKEKKSPLTSKMKKVQEDMVLERERQEEISAALTDVKITLKSLASKYQTIFERELREARRNANKGKKDGNNYSRIGVAYYSKQVISAAQRRLEDMTSSFEIKASIDELTSTLAILNELPKVIGKVDVSALGRAARKMDRTAGSSGGDLIDALSKLSNLKFDGIDTGVVQDLVSKDEIEKWISDVDYAQDCFENGSDEQVSGEKILDAGKVIYQNQNHEDKKDDHQYSSSLATLRQMADSL